MNTHLSFHDARILFLVWMSCIGPEDANLWVSERGFGLFPPAPERRRKAKVRSTVRPVQLSCKLFPWYQRTRHTLAESSSPSVQETSRRFRIRGQ